MTRKAEEQYPMHTSKFDDTVKAITGWLFLEASDSEILPTDLAVSLLKQENNSEQ